MGLKAASLLLLDIGNTRLKWALAKGDQWRDGAPIVHRADDLERTLGLAFATVPTPDAIWLADVSQQEPSARVVAWLKNRFALTPRFARTPASGSGLSNAYAEPHRLGVDRWLAMLGGHQRGRGLIVADAGSALTLDAVNAAGQHLGGLIFPGFEMLTRALLRDTEQVRIDAPLRYQPSRGFRLGSSTQACVESAINLAAIALIERVVSEISGELADTPRMILTGGDALHLKSGLSGAWVVEESLVLRGLARYASQFEEPV